MIKSQICVDIKENIWELRDFSVLHSKPLREVCVRIILLFVFILKSPECSKQSL